MSSSCSGWLYVKSQGWSTATTKLHARSSSHDIMRKKRITQHIPAGRPAGKQEGAYDSATAVAVDDDVHDR